GSCPSTGFRSRIPGSSTTRRLRSATRATSADPGEATRHFTQCSTSRTTLQRGGGVALGSPFLLTYLMPPGSDEMVHFVNYWLDLRKADGRYERERTSWIRGQVTEIPRHDRRDARGRSGERRSLLERPDRGVDLREVRQHPIVGNDHDPRIRKQAGGQRPE